MFREVAPLSYRFEIVFVKRSRIVDMLFRRIFFFVTFVVTATLAAHGQDSTRGRKYKAPPATSHIEIMVVMGFNGKPIPNAAVIFHPVKDDRDEGNLEIKTDPDGKAIIDVIPTGSTVTLQVIANGFATHAEEFVLSDASKSILVKMLRPQAQISVYEDNRGKPSERAPGVQEPVKPTPPPPAQPSTPAVPPQQ
jgi:hypothetical protein